MNGESIIDKGSSSSNAISIKTGRSDTMKKPMIILLVLFISLMGSESNAQELKKDDQLPPIEQLPQEGEMKSFYELDDVYSFKLFNSKGGLLIADRGKFIDTSDLPKGAYFIKYNGKKVKYEKQ